MIAHTEQGLGFIGTSGLGASFTDEFRRVWGKYFPWIVVGSVTVMVFALLKRLIK